MPTLTEPRRRVLTYLCRGQRCLTDAQVPCSELVWDCQTTFALVNAMQRDGLLRLDDDAHTDEWCDVYASATEAGVEALGADALEADGR